MHICARDLLKIEQIIADRQPEPGESLAEALELIRKAKDARADPALIQATQDTYATDELEIDDDAGTSEADDGTWVQAWVWMPKEEGNDDDIVPEPS